jgi:hypothetical protein
MNDFIDTLDDFIDAFGRLYHEKKGLLPVRKQSLSLSVCRL